MEQPTRDFITVTLKKANWDAVVSVLETEYQQRGKDWLQWGNYVRDTIQANSNKATSSDALVAVILSKEGWKTVNTLIATNCSQRGPEWKTWAEYIIQRIQQAIDNTKNVPPKNDSRKKATPEARHQVQFDANGKVLSINVPQGKWALRQNGQNKYYTQKAHSLLEATEILKKIGSIPQLTYYTVNTPDGSLGRDIQGFYTEAPLKTQGLIVESRFSKHEEVELLSLKGFGDVMANQTTAALLKRQGDYSRLVLLMKCGHCNYESPVETQPGQLVRECYCCGVKNKGHRGNINVFLGSSMVEI